MSRVTPIDEYLDQISEEQRALRFSPPGSPLAGRNQQHPWLCPQPGFVSFDFAGSIALPAAASGDQVVLSWRVPSGFDGVIKRLSHNVTFPGFVEGSGDLIWRIRADGRAIKNYDAMTVQFGSLVSARPTDGILIYSTQLIEYVVNNAALTAGGVFLISTLAGWYWPRQES